jgi:NTP pyrophosphatase (non-canonical NTP hydrolase)
MKAATVQEIKQELVNLPQSKVTELCLRLARFKKENKELLTYLLFEADDTALYIKHVNEEVDELFEEINKSNVYFVKKTLRKIARTAAKYIRYSGSETVEAEVLIHLCKRIKELGRAINSNTIISNIYKAQLKKINKAVASMHEDLQYDYVKAVRKLEAE